MELVSVQVCLLMIWSVTLAVAAPLGSSGYYILHQPQNVFVPVIQPSPLILVPSSAYLADDGIVQTLPLRYIEDRAEPSSKPPRRGPLRIFFLFSRFPWPLENVVQRIQNYFSTYTQLPVEAALLEEADLGPDPLPVDELEPDRPHINSGINPGPLQPGELHNSTEDELEPEQPDINPGPLRPAEHQGELQGNNSTAASVAEETTVSEVTEVTTTEQEIENSMEEVVSSENQGPPQAEVVIKSENLPMQARLPHLEEFDDLLYS